MALEGIDYSDARPGGAKIRAEGKSFVVRYLYPPVAGGKGLSTAEVADLLGHGIAIALVYEGTPGGALNGRSQGITDAKHAVALLAALPALDQHLPIYFAVDFDPKPTELAAIDNYFAGVESVLGKARTGAYGGYTTITHLAGTGHVSWYWQTYAWSAGHLSSHAHLYQYSNGAWGGSVDLTRALVAEFGQHHPAVAPAAPVTPAPAKPAAVPEEDDVNPCYFKGDKSGDIFILNRQTGTKRHVLHPEWQAAGHGQSVIVIHQADCDAIPSA